MLGVLDWKFSEGMGVPHSLEFQKNGGVAALNFQRRETAKALVAIADLLTFLVCKSDR